MKEYAYSFSYEKHIQAYINLYRELLQHYTLRPIKAMNRICFITRNYKDTNSAGNKAKTDMENILISLGATNLGLQRTFYKSHIIAFFLNLCGIIKASLLLSPNDRLVLQYPLKKYYTWICRIAHLRNAKVITLVHDLGSFEEENLPYHKR